jgi:hypothetical protein
MDRAEGLRRERPLMQLIAVLAQRMLDATW